jgi:lysophospholipase L1-like esterase
MIIDHPTPVLPFAGLVALLQGAPWRRLAVLGDSIAEGVGEPHPGYRNLSWIDRIAEPLRAATGGLAVTNLGRRDLLAREVRERQLLPALAFEPDLAIVAAGGNDALRRSFAREAVECELDGIVGPLRAAGADVLMVELLDIVASGLVPAERAASLDERFSALAGATRAVALRHGAILLGMRHHPASADPGVWASDRLHLNARGHAIVASEAVRALHQAISHRRAARMTPGDPSRLDTHHPLTVELTDEEILEDLSWPGPPPGRWPVPTAPVAEIRRHDTPPERLDEAA